MEIRLHHARCCVACRPSFNFSLVTFIGYLYFVKYTFPYCDKECIAERGYMQCRSVPSLLSRLFEVSYAKQLSFQYCRRYSEYQKSQLPWIISRSLIWPGRVVWVLEAVNGILQLRVNTFRTLDIKWVTYIENIGKHSFVNCNINLLGEFYFRFQRSCLRLRYCFEYI